MQTTEKTMGDSANPYPTTVAPGAQPLGEKQ
jgi:hypothetical protein